MKTMLATTLLCLMPTLVMGQSSHRGLTPLGNPGELVAAESALAHLARDKGASAALAATADDAAEVVAPVRSPAKVWVRTHDAAPWFADRQTDTVWASCDGTAGVSSGLWRGGWFAMVWKRQKKLNYKWLLADAAPLTAQPPAPDWITGKVADCPHHDDATVPPGGAESGDGRSDDGSLVWRSRVQGDGARVLKVWVWQDGAMRSVIDRLTPAGV